jgi:hypothetical protein
MVWDVTPRFKPVRSGVDRRRQPAAGFAPERRQVTDRRGQEPSRQWARGWLCFETTRERRRLAPVPEDWGNCPDEALERYRRSAVIVETSW